MKYGYKNSKDEVIIRDFPMNGDIPSYVEFNNDKYYRLWSTTITVPEEFHDGRPFNYDKSPSGKKHFW